MNYVYVDQILENMYNTTLFAFLKMMSIKCSFHLFQITAQLYVWKLL